MSPRHPRSAWAAVLATTVLVAGGNAMAETPASPAPSASLTQLPLESNGVEQQIRLRHKGPLIDLDSILDPNQPDFYLEVISPGGAPDPAKRPSEAPGTPPPASPAPVATPTPAPTSTAEPEEEPSLAPTPKPTAKPKKATPRPVLETPEPEAATPEPTVAPIPTVAPSVAPTPTALPSLAPLPGRTTTELMYQAQRWANLGQYRRALDLVDEAMAQDPKLPPLLALRGSILFKMKDAPGAETAWSRAVELDPSLADVKASLEWLRKRRITTEVER